MKEMDMVIIKAKIRCQRKFEFKKKRRLRVEKKGAQDWENISFEMSFYNSPLLKLQIPLICIFYFVFFNINNKLHKCLSLTN